MNLQTLLHQQSMRLRSGLLEVVSEKPCSVGGSVVLSEDRVQFDREKIVRDCYWTTHVPFIT